MSLKALLIKIDFPTVWILTNELSTLFLVLMGLFMGSEVAGGHKALITLGTLEGLFTSVDFLVSLEVGDLKR